MENIGRKLKIVRELYNYTQAYVAQKLAIEQASYARLEKKDKISIEMLEKIAKEVYQLDRSKLESLPIDPQLIIHKVSDNYGQFVHSSNVTINNGSTIQENLKVLKNDIDEIKKSFQELISLLKNK